MGMRAQTKGVHFDTLHPKSGCVQMISPLSYSGLGPFTSFAPRSAVRNLWQISSLAAKKPCLIHIPDRCSSGSQCQTFALLMSS